MLLPAVIFFGAWQVSSYLAAALYLPVGLMLFLGLISSGGSGETKQAGLGCVAVFGFISVGCAIGIAASHFLNTIRA